ncbi:MAG: sigma-54 interaction domain-containing protein [Planctomycetota bacterium]
MSAPTGLATHRDLVGQAPALLRVRDSIEKVARAPRTTVLVTGETGTGKELVARAIHARSARQSRPFVAVNCSQSTPELFASELFGHVPGAFTGALARGRAGLFATAEGGTLLLDEIGELAPTAQAQLLRVLQERTFRPVGGTSDLPMDVRIIAATHRDLPSLVSAGTFREDLWYRLNVAAIHVPALRERRADIPALVEHLLQRIARDHGIEPPGIAEDALDGLARQSWPGTVRELAHTLERAVIEAASARLEVAHFRPAPDRKPPRSESGFTLDVEDLSLAAVERSLIARVLTEAGGNRSRAARVLGVHRATLHGKLRARSCSAK